MWPYMDWRRAEEDEAEEVCERAEGEEEREDKGEEGPRVERRRKEGLSARRSSLSSSRCCEREFGPARRGVGDAVDMGGGAPWMVLQQSPHTRASRTGLSGLSYARRGFGVSRGGWRNASLEVSRSGVV